MIVGVIAKLCLVGGSELRGIAKPAVLQVCRRQPGGHAESVVGVLAQRLAEILAGHAHREGIHLRRDRQALRLPHEIQDLGFVAGDQHRIDVLASDLRQQRIEVGGVGAVALVHGHGQTCLLQLRPRALRHRNVEGIVGI